jgi:CRISPR-associated endonuclease/helicase Cas3
MVAGLSSPLPRSLWAKSSRNGKPGESLAAHTVAVVKMLSRLAVRAPGLARVADDERLWHRAFWACWLHDLGKGASGFQCVLRSDGQHWEHRHEVLSLAFLPWVAEPGTDDFVWITAGVVSHHRDASVILQDRYDIGRSVEAYTRAALSEMVAQLDEHTVDALIRFVVETGPAWLASSTLVARGVEIPSGLIPDRRVFRSEAAGWILEALRGYGRLVSRPDSQADGGARRQGILLRGLVQLADHLASAHAGAIESLELPGVVDLFKRLGITVSDGDLASHQVGARARVGSLVLAAPTGSGKTEAAILWAGRQQAESSRSRRLVYLLPYQASLNAMQMRLNRTLKTEVGLVHAKATQAIYRTLVEQEYRPAVAAAKAYAANNLARMHHPSVWVGTPYQLLRGAYRLPGYEQIWTVLAGSQIVVDEPHAYEPERLGLILGMLAELVRNWDVRVCAMTATLPNWTRSLLETAVGASSLDIDASLFARYRRHKLQVVRGEVLDETVLDRIAEAARRGLSVLVAVNTIARAQRVYSMLVKRRGQDQVRLIHSRFIAQHRTEKEQEILRLLGVGVERASSEGLVVVATQVVEVSLNLDFDTIFSEPAPLEALAQRFGRVNRRGTKGIVPVHVLNQPHGGQGIYHGTLVERTLAWLAASDGETLDEARLTSALDQIYGEDLAEMFRSKVEATWRDFGAVCIRGLVPFASDEELADRFDELFDGTEILPASFVERYRGQREQEPLEAHGLLVPLSERWRRELRRRGLAAWSPDLRQWVADVPYDGTNGLMLPDRSRPE